MHTPSIVRQAAGWIAFAAGLWIIFMGYGHLFDMDEQVTTWNDFTVLTPAALDFVILLIQAVGILLITMGLLSVYFSFRLRRGDRTAWLFFASQVLLFIARTVIEINHPVAVPEPQPMVLRLMIVTSIWFLVPVLLTAPDLFEKKKQPVVVS